MEALQETLFLSPDFKYYIAAIQILTQIAKMIF